MTASPEKAQTKLLRPLLTRSNAVEDLPEAVVNDFGEYELKPESPVKKNEDLAQESERKSPER